MINVHINKNVIEKLHLDKLFGLQKADASIKSQDSWDLEVQ